MISVRFQGKPFSLTVIQFCAPTTDAKEAEVNRFYEDVQHLLELTLKKDVLLIIGDWNAKGESQKILGIIGKFGLGVQNDTGQGGREHVGHIKHAFPTAREMPLYVDIIRWSVLKSD